MPKKKNASSLISELKRKTRRNYSSEEKIFMKTTINKLNKSLLLLVLFLSFSTWAQTKLPSFFNNNMVLQRNESVSIWGQDKSGVKIEVSGSWGDKETVKTNKDGYWELKLKTPEAGGPYMVVINGSEKIILNNVLIGEVWLCSGQSNMWMPLKGYNNSRINGRNETILNSKNDQIRFFSTDRNASVELLEDVTGQWLVAESATLADFSALAYYFGLKLNNILEVPIGLIHTSWGGSRVEAWIDKQSLLKFKEIEIPIQITEETPKNQSPTLLYNAMLHPFVPFTLKGFIWYQGESNVYRAEAYKKLFPAMIGSWRDKWQKSEMPFYFVQIAPYGYGEYGEINSAFLREAQMQTMQLSEHTGMAVTLDIGDCTDIHPAEKELIGNRLAYWALANDYGLAGISYSGPIYRTMEKIADGKIKIIFDFCENGLTIIGGELNGFEIAGEDKVFHSAEAQINSDRSVSVWSELIKDPIAVRYAFGNCPEANLFNTEGLPASSFRTDDWVEE